MIHTGFQLFLFPFVWLLAPLLWDQMVFTSHTHSLSFSVAHSQEKSHLYPIKTSLSPTKLIACVSAYVQAISRGCTEFRFAAQQKKRTETINSSSNIFLDHDAKKRKTLKCRKCVKKNPNKAGPGISFINLPEIVWDMNYSITRLSGLLRKDPPA